MCLLGPFAASGQVAPPASTEIRTDGRFGAVYDVPDVGGTFEIPETLADSTEVGRRSGGNLFHSFDAFQLAQGDTALFTVDQATDNLVALFPNGPTPIFGTLATEEPGMATWLLGPDGFFFGDGAALDLQGSLHVSSADQLHFDDGFDLEVLSGDASVTAAAPEAFGFSWPEPGPIQLVGVDAAQFLVPAGETVSLVGGTVFVDGPIANGVGRAVLAEDGTIQVAAVKGPTSGVGETLVPVDVSQLDVETLDPSQLGEIDLGSATRGAQLDVSDTDGMGASPGRIVVRGGQLVMLGGSDLIAANQGVGDPDVPFDSIDVQATEVAMTGGEMTSTGSNGARAGDVRVRGDRLELDGGAQIRSRLPTVGSESQGGDVHVEFEESISLAGGSEISTKTLSNREGGDVFVSTGTLDLSGGSTIATLTERQTAGKAGRVGIEAQEVTLREGSLIATAPEESGFFIRDSGFAGGGDVVIDAEHLVVEGGSNVAASSFGNGNAGDVLVKNGDGMAESVRVTGGGGPSTFTRITARTEGDGAAGSVEVRARSLVLEDGGVVSTASVGDAPAGNVTVVGETVTVSGVDPDTPDNRSAILATTSGAGAAGDIDVTASDRLTIAAGGQISVQSDNALSGEPGSITITAGDIAISGSEDAILASSLSPEDGGDIVLAATGDIQIEGASPVIRTSSQSQSGGNITIEAGGTVQIQGGADIVADATASVSSTDQAGTIRIAGGGVLVSGGSSLTAIAGQGALGGSIDIETPVFLLPGGVLIDTSEEGSSGERFESLFGDVFDVTSSFGGGEIEIQTPESQLTAQVAALPSNYLDIDRLAVNQCAAREGPAGSLVIEGRDRAPLAPDEELPAFYPGAGAP